MADKKGDPTKMPVSCRVNTSNQCPNLQSREISLIEKTCWCDVCGERFMLYGRRHEGPPPSGAGG